MTSTTSGDPSPEFEETDPHDKSAEIQPGEAITAKRLREEQLERQKRRRTSNTAKGTRSKNSIWSSLAATVTSSNDGVAHFHCSVCSENGKMNNNGSNSNIIAHYKKHHAPTYKKLHIHDKQNGTEATIRSAISAEYNRRQATMKPKRLSFKSSSISRKPPDSAQRASE